jgi:hypothetical protein
MNDEPPLTIWLQNGVADPKQDRTAGTYVVTENVRYPGM